MHVSEPVEVTGVDPLDPRQVRETLSALAYDHQVVVQQVEELSPTGWVQVLIHSHNESDMNAALSFLSSRTSDDSFHDAEALRAAKGLAPALELVDDASSVDTGAADGSDAPVDGEAPATPVAALQDVYAAQRAASSSEANEGTVAVSQTPETTAGERRHPRWTCAGCADCVDEVPPGT